MGVKLVSASAGSVEIVAPTTASNYTATMPAGTGNVVVNGINSSIVSGTSQASTSGTSIDFTSIPSWVKRITVMFNGVSTNGTTDIIVQIGSGSVTTTGYLTQRGFIQATSANASTSGTASMVILTSAGASSVMMGHSVLTNISSNSWVASANFSQPASSLVGFSAGSITLGGVLDRVRITTVNGTDTFDAGSINILYE
jgi:hypothetical protein